MKFTGEEIKALRQRLGWSTADLSRRLSCSVNRLRDLEAGTLTPEISEMEQFTLLQVHLTNYNEQLETSPMAEVALRTNGYDQIHIKDLKSN